MKRDEPFLYRWEGHNLKTRFLFAPTALVIAHWNALSPHKGVVAATKVTATARRVRFDARDALSPFPREEYSSKTSMDRHTGSRALGGTLHCGGAIAPSAARIVENTFDDDEKVRRELWQYLQHWPGKEMSRTLQAVAGLVLRPLSVVAEHGIRAAYPIDRPAERTVPASTLLLWQAGRGAVATRF